MNKKDMYPIWAKKEENESKRKKKQSYKIK